MPDLLIWPAPIPTWDEAVPLGNGLLGVLLWGGERTLRLTLDRADLWDLRTPEPFTRPDWTWQNLRALVEARQWEEITTRFIAPGSQCPYPTKLPAGRLFIDLPASDRLSTFSLDRTTALGTAKWGGGELAAFCYATTAVTCIRFRGEGARWRLEPPPFAPHNAQPTLNLASLGYPCHTAWQTDTESGFVQPLLDQSAFAFVVLTSHHDGWTELTLAVEQGTTCEEAKSRALAIAQPVRDAGWAATFSRHAAEWARLRNRSRVDLPDATLAEHYRQASYLLASASRPDGPPIALQAVWTADDGNLPPWKGDYHHNLNTQLSYWPHLTAGHADRMRGFLDFMLEREPLHRELARKFFGAEGIFIPGAMAFDGSLIGGYAQVSYCPTNGAWIAQLFHRYWKTTGDNAFLRARIYPYCKGVGDLLLFLLEKGDDGLLRLPLSASPEIHEGAPEGWLTPNSNYDLALMQWLFAANAEMATALGESPAPWSTALAALPPLAIADTTVDEIPVPGPGPFLIAPGKPLHESHRHHSHLMALYPLGLVDSDDDPNTRAVIAQSFRQLDKLSTGLWVGYSFPWLACLAARARQPERARHALKTFVENFISPNGFHLNGDFRQRGISAWNYRPFTLEGNFAYLEAIHEMLLQNARGLLRIFPAVPEDWQEVSFRDLHTEGGLKVSATRTGGRTTTVQLSATREASIRLQDPFAGKGTWTQPPSDLQNGILAFSITEGETITGCA